MNWVRYLRMLEIIIVISIILISADWWIRNRAGQAVTTYHQQVIIPLTRPIPAPAK